MERYKYRHTYVRGCICFGYQAVNGIL